MLTAGVEPPTDIFMPELDTVAGLAQVALLVISQLTASPLARDEVMYVALLVPTSLPFTFHW